MTEHAPPQRPREALEHAGPHLASSEPPRASEGQLGASARAWVLLPDRREAEGVWCGCTLLGAPRHRVAIVESDVRAPYSVRLVQVDGEEAPRLVAIERIFEGERPPGAT